MKDVEIAGVCDINVEKARSLAAKFRIEKVFDNYLDLFEIKDLELVDICTPVSTHARIVCDAAKAVQAILVEKPMAMNVLECDRIIDEVKKSGSKLCIGHNQIFSPLIQRAKALVDSRVFDLLCFRTTQKESFELLKASNLAPAWNVSPEQRGIIWEVCCHLAYLQLHFLPDISEVYAVGGKIRYPVYDDFSVLLRTKGQRFGLIELSWLSNETEIVYEIRDSHGKRAEVYREFDFFLENTEKPPFTVGGVAKNFFADEKRLLQKWARFGSSYFRKRKLLPTFNLIDSYVEAIKKDMPPPVTPEDGRKTINLLERIEKSLEERRTIRLSD
jgi:predicted dehydrogenase